MKEISCNDSAIDMIAQVLEEMKTAAGSGRRNLRIVVLYNDNRIDKNKCPEIVRNCGLHATTVYCAGGKHYWDYTNVKKAFEELTENND